MSAHVTDTPPALCSSCFGQYPDRQHIDFEASWDGPVVEGGVAGEDGTVVSRIPVAIDELILCEECVREGARLLGMTDENSGELERLREQLRETREREAGLKAYVDQLEKTVAAKPAPTKKARGG